MTNYEPIASIAIIFTMIVSNSIQDHETKKKGDTDPIIESVSSSKEKYYGWVFKHATESEGENDNKEERIGSIVLIYLL